MISDDWLNLNTKCCTPFYSKFSPLFLMILPVQGATSTASDVGVMSRHWHLKG